MRYRILASVVVLAILAILYIATQDVTSEIPNDTPVSLPQ